MKCPHCSSLMKCISAINPIPGQPGRERMDLHCSKESEDGRRGCGVQCHMGVITEDPKEWECHEYGFTFYSQSKWYRLRSHNHIVDPYHQHRENIAQTLLFSNSGAIMVHLPYFMPISTGDNMHEEAWALFHRLNGLVIYS